MPHTQINPENVGKFQKLIVQNPIAFVAVVFFLMFAFTYSINLANNSNAEKEWKEKYEEERAKNDKLNTQLLIKAGVLEKAKEVIIEADSTLKKNNISEKIQKLNE